MISKDRLNSVLLHHNAIRKGLGKKIFEKEQLKKDLHIESPETHIKCYLSEDEPIDIVENVGIIDLSSAYPRILSCHPDINTAIQYIFKEMLDEKKEKSLITPAY